jgi:uncharacterized protein YndB with AHSA1/START domain
MSQFRQQALIEAPVEEVWELIGNPARHPEWWPRVVEVRGERFDQGDQYAQVTRSPTGEANTTFSIDARDELRHLHLRCMQTGAYADWALTEARGNTFVDVTFGMNPQRVTERVFDRAFGRRYFRSWLTQSLQALQRAAGAVGSARAPRG